MPANDHSVTAPLAIQFAGEDPRSGGRPEGRGGPSSAPPKRSPGVVTWVMLGALAVLLYVVLTSSTSTGMRVS